MVERPTRPTVGPDTVLDTAWNRLMEDGVGFMGLHGMGGVGKTTLFKKIHNKFDEIAGTFDVVIWVVVSQGAKISKLQEDIAQKLNLCSDEWTNKNEGDKAGDIHKFLKGKKFVLMLDDLWEKVDLEAIGVPFPTEVNKCKVAFTTRSLEVCGRMEDHKPMEVKCLEPVEAWELFKYKVGENILRSNPIIVELAENVAEKCCGLPLALTVIGETMASKTTVQEWEHAVDVLTSSAADFSDMEDKILPILKYSYDSLVDENIRSCFLYCALFQEDFQIPKEELIDYWICEGFMGEYQDIKKARNKGYATLCTLLSANLLTKVGTTTVVMHDVIREMALWIASDFGKLKETFVVQTKVGLHEMPKIKDWGAVRRMSLMDNNIEEITCGSSCPELTTLFLQHNQLSSLLGEFILSMQKLAVLNLSRNYFFNELPEQISELTSLQYLGLSYTSIEQLPAGFQELKKLTHLNLSDTSSLCSISGISKLSSLRILELQCSNVHGDVRLMKELQLLKHLQVLNITISTELVLELLSGDQRLASCINILGISDFQQKLLNISLLASMENLCELWVVNSHVSDMTCRESEMDLSDLHNLTRPCFTNLSSVTIANCDSIKDLTWLLFATNLVDLQILYSEEIEEIVNKEKATKLIGITPFQKLEVLKLDNLPNLESIYWSSLPFPFLGHITARNCPKLRKLPLNATSVPQVEAFVIDMDPREQKTDLEWEDEDTRNRFLPSFDRFCIGPIVSTSRVWTYEELYSLYWD